MQAAEGNANAWQAQMRVETEQSQADLHSTVAQCAALRAERDKLASKLSQACLSPACAAA